MYLEIYKGQQLLHRDDDLSPYMLLGWMRYLGSENVSDLVIASPAISLKMSARGEKINLSFSVEGNTNERNLTVLRATAVEMALYFLKNEGLPRE